MYIERKQDISVIYFLRSLFADAPFITIVDEFPTDSLVIPTIALETDTIDYVNYEIGNRNFLQYRTWYFNVFADNKSQRDEYSYRIVNALKNPISVYDYDLGFPPTVVPKLGSLMTDRLSTKPIQIFPEQTEKLYYRSVTELVTYYDQIS